jgi:hypothetical protein
MGNQPSSLPPPPPPISLEQFRDAFDSEKNGVNASVAKTNADSAAAFTDLGYKIKDGVTDTAYKVKDVATDTGYKIKDVSLDAGDKLKWAFTNDKAMDVYKSTANSLSIVASTLTGIAIDTKFNDSSVPNFGRIQATNSTETTSETNSSLPTVPVAPSQPIVSSGDGQVFELSAYNPYNTSMATDQSQAMKNAAIDPSMYAVVAIPIVGIIILMIARS